jgi:menaquinone-dependent protoporphyrinogen IX oxidase
MKGIVVYDSYYGNTKRVAEAIAEQIRADGHEAELRSLREKYPSPPQGDFLFVGSPVRIARVTRRARKFVKTLDAEAWRNKPVAIFVTVLPSNPNETDPKKKADAEKWVLSPGPKLRDMAKSRGLNVVDKVLMAVVKEVKGPLAEDAVEVAKQFAHEFVETLKK